MPSTGCEPSTENLQSDVKQLWPLLNTSNFILLCMTMALIVLPFFWNDLIVNPSYLTTYLTSILHIFKKNSPKPDILEDKAFGKKCSHNEMSEIPSTTETSVKYFSDAQNLIINGGNFNSTSVTVKQGTQMDRAMQGIVKGLSVFTEENVSLGREIYKGRGYRFYSAQSSGRVVALKVYEGSRAKERGIKGALFYREVIHPNIPFMTAVSSLGSDRSFLVFDGEYDGPLDYTLTQVLKKGLKQSLTLGMQTVAGLSAGLDYLHDQKYPFTSVPGLNHFVLFNSRGKIIISFDPEDLLPTSPSGQQFGGALDVFHGLCHKTFDNACKAHYESRQTEHNYIDELEIEAEISDDDLSEARFEEVENHRQLLGHAKQRDDLLSNKGSFAPGPSSAPIPSMSARPLRKAPRKKQPSGRRWELVWKPAGTHTLHEISREFQYFLNDESSSSEPALNRRRGRYAARTSHRCPGYSRIEITLTTDITRSTIVSHASPTPHEICPVCQEVVKAAEIFNCSCGGQDDESTPTTRCSSCLEWHHLPCVDYDIDPGALKFVCRRCKEVAEFASPQLKSPYRIIPLLHSNRASALLTRFEQGGQRIDLDEAISLHRRALELRLSIDPDRAVSLNNLANSLSTRFQQGGQRSDLNEAISFHRHALELRPSPHPDRSSSLFALGNILVDAHSLTNGNSEFLEEAMSSFYTAIHCLSQSPSRRFLIAKSWIRHAENHQHISAFDAYDAAMQVLPQLDAQSLQEALGSSIHGLIRDASRCAIRTGNLFRAIEFLEVGRSIFWSQSLSLRSPFDQLQSIEPQLADKLRDVSTALELGSHYGISADIPDNQEKLSKDEEAAQLNHLNKEWDNGIHDIRNLKGFEDFLRPRRLSALQTAALDHPVVVLVAHDDGSHCLILKSTAIHYIELPSIDTRKLQNLAKLLRDDVSQLTISPEDVTALMGENDGARNKDKLARSDDIFKFVLRILWNEVVKPVVNFLHIEKIRSGELLPVLQWCPTGVFTFLPIHAAGCYDIGLSLECASDYFISSYTPTIGTLLTHNPAPSTEFKMMVVTQPTQLPSTITQLKNIERRVPTEALIKFGVPGIPAKIEAVTSSLSNSSIVHFACHGKQDRFKPLDSGFQLDDGLLRVSRILKDTMPNGSLAFLSACETGKGDENLPDEAMSLGASLLFSGFHRVVTTMWDTMDQDGPTMADTFYEELFRDPNGQPALEPDITKSARALDIAVKKLRSQNVSFRRWVPFVHMGK